MGWSSPSINNLPSMARRHPHIHRKAFRKGPQRNLSSQKVSELMSRRHIFNDVQLHRRSFSLDRNKSCAARRRWMQNAFSISPMIYEPIIASRAQGQELLFRISAAHTHRAPTHSAPTLKRANFSFYWEKHQQEDCVIFLPLGAQKALAPIQSGAGILFVLRDQKTAGQALSEATSYLWPPLCSSYSWHWQINFAIGIMSAINSALFLSACCYLPWRDNKSRCTFAQLLLSGRKGLSTMCYVCVLLLLSNASGDTLDIYLWREPCFARSRTGGKSH